MKFLTTLLISLLIALTSEKGAEAQTEPNGFNIIGTWNSACHKGADGFFIEDTYEFKLDQTFHREQKKYISEDCSLDVLNELRIYDGHYQIASSAKKAEKNISTIDFFIERVLSAAFDEMPGESSKESYFCRVTDWKRGEQRDVTGILCSGKMIPTGTVIYDTVQPSGDALYFGAQSRFRDISKRRNRPKRLNKDVVFVRSSSV